MRQYKHLKGIILSAIVMSAFYLFCVAPIDPYSDLKTSSQLVLRNSIGQIDTLSIEDSVGKPVSIGICRYLPKNIDSVKLIVASKLAITSTTSYTVLDTVIHFFNTSKAYDTLWKQITFTSAGEFQVISNAFTSAALAGKTLIDSASIIIYNRSVLNNFPPKWDTDTIKMNVFSGAAISINLADTCVDPNNDQLSFSLLSGLPVNDTIISGIYRFTPLVSDTGSYNIHIVAADVYLATDTLTIALIVRPVPIDSIKPVYKLVRPNKDSISVNATSYKIDIIFTDASTIASVKCSTATASIAVDHTDSLYSAIVTGLQANVYNAITFVAIDGSSKANETRKTLYIKNDPLLQDLAGPILRRGLPSRDSITTTIDSVAISIIATDQSGVASIACLLGTTAFTTVKKADSIYSAVIKGLSATATNRVSFVATDSSSNKNTDTLTFFIKYDPTTNDHQKPTMIRKAPAIDSATVNSASTTVSIMAKDLSGIASVVCSFGSATPTVTATDSIYSATVTGLVANQFNRIRFIATDASSNGNKETLFVTIKSDPSIIDNQQPTMSRKTPAIDSATVTSSSTTISVVAKDASGIASVVCSMGDSTFAVTATDSIYSATAKGLIVNQFNKIRFIATDASSSGNKETLFVTVKYIPAIVDNKKPLLKRKTPANDSTAVSSASTTLSIVATDSSGIASVVCSLGDSTFAVTAADSVYSATVNGLIVNQFNKIRFIATDASSNGNKETLFVTIKYDPTIADNSPPLFTKITGPASGSTVATAAVSYEYAITDDNGIDSVYWALNGTRQGYLPKATSEHYVLSATLTAQSNRIVIHAWDKSPNHNQDSAVITLNYNQPPVAISDTTLTTPRATPRSITLTATDPENNTLSAWTVTGPKHGAITAARPMFTYTPTGNYEGKDTLTFKVSDGISISNVALIVITVTANNIPPVISTLTLSNGGSVDKGNPVTFTATINADAYPTPVYRLVKQPYSATDTIASGNVSGTTITYTINPTAYTSAGNYKMVVRNIVTTVESNVAALTINDKTKPTISLNGSATVTVNQGGPWTDPSATATDDKDGPITPVLTGALDLTVAGTYTLTYTATDQAGNSNSVQRTVKVVSVWAKKGSEFFSNVSRSILKNDVLYFAEASDAELWLRKLGSSGITAETSVPGFPYNGLSLDVGNDGTMLFVGTQTRIASWNGGTWTTVVDSTNMQWNSIGGFAMHIGAGNRPYIASMDPNNFALRVRKLMGGVWTIVGYDQDIPLGPGGAHDQHFCIVSGGPAVFTIGRDYTTPVISTANLSGSAWNVVNISSGTNDESRANLQIIASGTDVYEGFTQANGSAPSVSKWNGSGWTTTGYPENSTTGDGGFSIGCSPSGILYAAYIEGTSAVIKKYTGSSWVNVPETGSAAAFTTDADQIQIVPGTSKCYAVTIKGAGSELSIWSIDQ